MFTDSVEETIASLFTVVCVMAYSVGFLLSFYLINLSSAAYAFFLINLSSAAYAFYLINSSSAACAF
jgi:hypothetical protein